MLSKTIHLRPLRSSHIIRVKSPERAARICERNSIIESEFEYKPILKTSYDSSVYKYQKERLSNPSNINDMKPYHTEGNNTRDLNSTPCHSVDYFVQKKKKYNQQANNISNIPPARVVSQEEFRALRSTSESPSHSLPKRGEEGDQRNIYRKNFYVSKPFAQINKDFKSLVPTAQTTSEDTPNWFQGTTKFYIKENLEQDKKLRNSNSSHPKTDIFGKPNIINYSQADYPFFAQPPSKGQRYELNKMVIVERRTEKDYDSRVPHVQLKWEEKPQNQSYDKVKMTGKIGNNGQPFIKNLQAKREFNPLIAYNKVGESYEAQRIKQEKLLELKIGHPNSEYIHAKRKAREDGFYGNRKEITSDNYQRSSFFV